MQELRTTFEMKEPRTIVAVMVLCSGCTALETRESQTWLAMHAIDTLQTARIADAPDCFREADPITRRLIGETPSRTSVAVWSLGIAALHLAATDWLLRNDHPRVARALQFIHSGVTASAVANNHAIGIRLGTPNRRRGACTPPVTITEDGELVEIP